MRLWTLGVLVPEGRTASREDDFVVSLLLCIITGKSSIKEHLLLTEFSESDTMFVVPPQSYGPSSQATPLLTPLNCVFHISLLPTPGTRIFLKLKMINIPNKKYHQPEHEHRCKSDEQLIVEHRLESYREGNLMI